MARPGGLIVFSFLEFDVQWDIFLANVERERAGEAEGAVLNVFIDPPAIRMWSAALGLEVVDIRSGRDRFIPMLEQAGDNDRPATTVMAAFGQSVCVLRKPADLAGSCGSPQVATSVTPAEEVAQLELKIDSLTQQISALRSSTSWRLTRPLRVLRAWMGAPPAA